ncbi:MAG: HAD hydrolase-like protein [Paracoccaceae bacterium]|jgi:phosphoglycolate phosphatase|nr:HAD hydrolase-like protein [Paracoccaceae bacterium]MDG1373187.1 HAD hydrolase-like protein [Paracoccaceae bacterium]MDG1969558.1 HAD hydrolase-like protein [Paracoccaceae bacterium]
MTTPNAWVFLDLDGTMTDAGPGITKSIAYALEKMGKTPPTLKDLEKYVGPALQETFPQLGVDDVDAALGFYRERYTDVGLFENSLYDGVHQMMDDLRAQGFKLAMATAKPLVYARRITEHYDLAPRMEQQFGSELGGWLTNKKDLLEHALKETGADPAASFMLGDRSHDAIGARHNNITPLGALWGFGSRPELEQAQCAAIGDAPADIAGIVESLT